MKKLIIGLVIMMAIIAGGIKAYNNGVGAWKTGDYILSHEIKEGEVYKLCTERGTLEYVLGYENVENSIKVYKANGTYGQVHRGLR